MSSQSNEVGKNVLPEHLGGGPYGLGDPNDKRLRKVEVEIIIPQKMRDRARKEKCKDIVDAFSKCSKENGLMVVTRCRAENKALWDCLTKWYENEEFKKTITDEYLEERSLYRATGIKSKMRKKDSAMF